MSTPLSQVPSFLPPFPDFMSIFKNSLESIKGTTYSSIFDDTYPSADMCKDGGKEFTEISTWYRDIWKSKTDPVTSNPIDIVSMCQAYQKECLININWTVVNSWGEDNSSTKDLEQFCPQPIHAKTSYSGFTFSTTDLKSSADLAASISTSSIGTFNGSYAPGLSTLDSSFMETQPETLKYLAFLSLLLPLIVVLALVVYICKRKKIFKKIRKSEGDANFSNLGLNLGLQSPPSTPSSSKLSSDFNTFERKERKVKKRGRNKSMPSRQLSTDSNNSTIYFVNFEDEKRESASEEPTEDPDKEKMMENWKLKLESLAEMLTRSDGNVNVTMNGNVDQEDC